MENHEDKKQNNRKQDEKRNTEADDNALTKEKEWDPDNHKNSDSGKTEDLKKKKEKSPDSKIRYS